VRRPNNCRQPIWFLSRSRKGNGLRAAWLAFVLAKLQDHPAKAIDELLPWNRKIAQDAAIQRAAVIELVTLIAALRRENEALAASASPGYARRVPRHDFEYRFL
jgi:hypothetical protein